MSALLGKHSFPQHGNPEWLDLGIAPEEPGGNRDKLWSLAGIFSTMPVRWSLRRTTRSSLEQWRSSRAKPVHAQAARPRRSSCRRHAERATLGASRRAI